MKKLIVFVSIFIGVFTVFGSAAAIPLAGEYTVNNTVTKLDDDSFIFTYDITNNNQQIGKSMTGLDGFFVQVPASAVITNITLPPSYKPGGYWTSCITSDSACKSSEDVISSNAPEVNLLPGNVWLFWWGNNPESVYPIGSTVRFSFQADGVNVGLTSSVSASYWAWNTPLSPYFESPGIAYYSFFSNSVTGPVNPITMTQSGIWPCMGHDPMRTGRSPSIGALTNNLKWNYKTGDSIPSSPIIGADGTVYVGSWDNKLYALNPDGSLKWSYQTENGIYSTPAIGADGTVYIGSLDNKLYALNPDGSLKWSYKTGDLIRSSPAIGSDGTVYVGSHDNKLYALNPTGSLKWSYQTEGDVESSPAIGTDGTVYVGSYISLYIEDEWIPNCKLYALNPDGSLKWAYQTGGGILSSPAIGADGTVYVGSYDKKLYALNPDGSLKWSYQTENGIYSSPAIGTNGTVYVGSGDKKLYALNPDGSLKWSYPTGNWVSSSPAIGADGTVYVGSYDKKLYALNPDGSLKWSYQTGGWVLSSPAIGADGTVYVGSHDGYLYAFGDKEKQVAKPTFSPSPGTFTDSVAVTITCTTTGATIRYTTDGSEPTDGSAVYTGPVTITKTTILKAKGFKANCSPSDTTQGTYSTGLRVELSGTNVIFLAGRTDVTIPLLGAYDPDFPILRHSVVSSDFLRENFPISLPAHADMVFTFQASGLIDYYNGLGAQSGIGFGPDGGEPNGSDLSNLDGISGYKGPQGALVGVFLDDSNPFGKKPPSTLNFWEGGIGTSFESLTPALGQVFFIGDGRTSNGKAQRFFTPAGATRLFIGIPDGWNFCGSPGYYEDNDGSFIVDIETFAAPEDKPILYEDFNDNITNTSLWEIKTDGSGPIIAETNGRLEISFPTNSADDPAKGAFSANYSSICKLKGDFDIQIDYELLNWPAKNGVRVGLTVIGPRRNEAVERVSLGNSDFSGYPSEEYVVDFTNGIQFMAAPPDNLSGKLRLVRSGATLTGYYYNNSWVPIYSTTVTTEDVGFCYSAWSHNYVFADREVKVAFDNFIINKGSYTCCKVSKPVLDPAPPASFAGSTTVKITCESGATIRYTTDNSEPTERSQIYTGPLTLTKTTTLKAKAFKANCSPSDTVPGTYTACKVSKPVLDPAPPASFAGSTTVKITCESGA
ncbi:MAG: PQQ-binding-like beta-propeller repeat protein, partial [bacterium]